MTERWEEIHKDIVAESMQGRGPEDPMAYSRIACQRLAKHEQMFALWKQEELEWNAVEERLINKIAELEARLRTIVEVFDVVDHRAMSCDGPVLPTEISQAEMSTIYSAALGGEVDGG